MCLKAPGWLWLPLVGYVLVHFDVWLALGWFTLCPGQVSICTRPARSPKSSNSLIFSTGPKTGSRCPIWLFKVTFGILISSPSLLEHFQTLSRSDKRTIRGGGNGTYWEPWFFRILSNVAPTPLEGPLMVLVNWKVICNASVRCLGVPGDDFGWYETTSLWPPNHPTPKPNFYFCLI